MLSIKSRVDEAYRWSKNWKGLDARVFGSGRGLPERIKLGQDTGTGTGLQEWVFRSAQAVRGSSSGSP